MRSALVGPLWPAPRIRAATSRFDGLANTQAMAEEGSAIAAKVLGMNVRGTWGWHIPAIEELQVIRSNLLQLADWDHRMRNHAPQAFASHQYWSSTQKENAATAWLMGMYPWAIPDTNWVSGCNGVRPAKVLKIKEAAFMHAPHLNDPEIVAPDLSGLADCPQVAEVLGRFVNEDAGRFYGRTHDLVAELAKIAGGARP